ncbi:hypothetical protein C8F01DRAFT_1106232 [Mycena amicta]|nr:hypothetical protein C8F01DRAFT_1106232 [Mycena amicta]
MAAHDDSDDAEYYSDTGERDNPTPEHFTTSTPVARTIRIPRKAKALDRKGRAICRIAHDNDSEDNCWPAKDIARIFGLSAHTIRFALNNDPYGDELRVDDTSRDYEFAGQGFKTIFPPIPEGEKIHPTKSMQSVASSSKTQASERAAKKRCKQIIQEPRQPNEELEDWENNPYFNRPAKKRRLEETVDESHPSRATRSSVPAQEQAAVDEDPPSCVNGSAAPRFSTFPPTKRLDIGKPNPGAVFLPIPLKKLQNGGAQSAARPMNFHAASSSPPAVNLETHSVCSLRRPLPTRRPTPISTLAAGASGHFERFATYGNTKYQCMFYPVAIPKFNPFLSRPQWLSRPLPTLRPTPSEHSPQVHQGIPSTSQRTTTHASGVCASNSPSVGQKLPEPPTPVVNPIENNHKYEETFSTLLRDTLGISDDRATAGAVQLETLGLSLERLSVLAEWKQDELHQLSSICMPVVRSMGVSPFEYVNKFETMIGSRKGKGLENPRPAVNTTTTTPTTLSRVLANAMGLDLSSYDKLLADQGLDLAALRESRTSGQQWTIVKRLVLDGAENSLLGAQEGMKSLELLALRMALGR